MMEDLAFPVKQNWVIKWCHVLTQVINKTMCNTFFRQCGFLLRGFLILYFKCKTVKNNQTYRRFFFFAWIIILSFSDIAVGQNTKNKLSEEKKKLENEIKEQKRLLEITKKNKTASLHEIQLITSQIHKQERLIQVINDEILSLDHEIGENMKELEALKNKLDILIDEYQKAVYIAYKYRNIVNKTGFILSSESLTQAIRRVNYLQEYAQFLNQQLKNILQTQEDIKRKDTLLRQNKEEKTLLFQTRNNEKQNLAKQQVEKNQIVSNLKKRETQLNNAIVKKVNRQKQIDAAIKKIIEEEIAASAKRAAAAKKGSTTTTAKNTSTPTKNVVITLTPEEANLASNFESNQGKLPWPVEKGTIITDFGAYNHPEVSSVKIANNGVNILTDKKAPVRAVFSGVVSRIMDIDGYKVLLIRHGNYITVYSNLSATNVKQNDKINTKQIIGYVKDNPADAHSELHFEIWKDKNPLNPSLWIKL
jgi:septal ring factor EnvC (AmiA/AmiB activator)